MQIAARFNRIDFITNDAAECAVSFIISKMTCFALNASFKARALLSD